MRLKEQTAVVTGAGSGIGRASALLFAVKGRSSRWSIASRRVAGNASQPFAT